MIVLHFSNLFYNKSSIIIIVIIAFTVKIIHRRGVVPIYLSIYIFSHFDYII